MSVQHAMHHHHSSLAYLRLDNLIVCAVGPASVHNNIHLYALAHEVHALHQRPQRFDRGIHNVAAAAAAAARRGGFMPVLRHPLPNRLASRLFVFVSLSFSLALPGERDTVKSGKG